jgi:hypothetical protein
MSSLKRKNSGVISSSTPAKLSTICVDTMYDLLEKTETYKGFTLRYMTHPLTIHSKFYWGKMISKDCLCIQSGELTPLNDAITKLMKKFPDHHPRLNMFKREAVFIKLNSATKFFSKTKERKVLSTPKEGELIYSRFSIVLKGVKVKDNNIYPIMFLKCGLIDQDAKQIIVNDCCSLHSECSDCD